MEKFLRYLTQTFSLFVLIAAISGLAFVVITPPLWGADESQHFIRAYQVSRFELSQKHVDINNKKSSGGTVPASFVRLDSLREKDITDAAPGESRQVDQRSAYSKVSETPANKDVLVANPYSKNIYSPLAYAAPAVGITVGGWFSQEPLSLLMAARIATLVLYILLVASALYVLRRVFIRWIVFVIALLPMAIFQASIVSPDSLLVGLSLLFFAVLYKVLCMKRRPRAIELGILALTACLLTLVKVPYILLVLSLTLLPQPKDISSRKKLFIKFGIPLLAVVVALFSLVTVKSVIATALPGVNSTAQLHWIIEHPFQYGYVLINSVSILDWVPQIIGLLGSSFIFIPGIVSQVLLVSLILVALSDTKRKGGNTEVTNRLSAIVYLGAGLLAALAIITTLYLTWTPVGADLVQGIQGRYFLPILIFVLVGLRMSTRARLVFLEKHIKIGCTMVSAGALIVSVLWYFRILYSL